MSKGFPRDNKTVAYWETFPPFEPTFDVYVKCYLNLAPTSIQVSILIDVFSAECRLLRHIFMGIIFSTVTFFIVGSFVVLYG